MPLSILDHVALAYEPVWGRSGALSGVRLRILALHPESVEISRLLRLLAEERSDRAPFLLLSFTDHHAALQALAEPPTEGLWLELPHGPDNRDGGFAAAVSRALVAGHRLVEPVDWGASLSAAPVIPGILQLIELDAIAQVSADLPAGQLFRHAAGIEAAVAGLDGLEIAGVVGWPYGQDNSESSMPVDKGCLERVLTALDQDASLETIEGLILQDVVLAYRAWSLLRSGVFGPDRQLDSLRQALMLLGQSRLRQWLLDQHAQASDDPRWWPLRQSLVLRAYLMVQVLEPGAELALASEIHLTGLFSRLDQVLHLPLAQAIENLPLGEAVAQALLDGAGPYQPYMDVACALEDIDAIERLPELLKAQGMRLDEVNRALVRLLRDQRVQT